MRAGGPVFVAGGMKVVRLRKLRSADAEYLSARWTGEQPLPGYALPQDREEMKALIEEMGILFRIAEEA